MALAFPNIDPVALDLGVIQIRWYALSYIAGLLASWWLVKRYYKNSPYHVHSKLRQGEWVDSLIGWLAFGVVLGGRLGYVLFYKPLDFLSNPIEIFQVWHGGMSFHGGALGVIIVMVGFTRYHRISFYEIADYFAPTIPIGIFFGRLGNFVNGELFGRVTDAPWGMVFPKGGDMPRHPSQLYEAMMEGIVLFIVLYLWRRLGKGLRYQGQLSGVFLTGYALARFAVESVREPDAHLGFLWGGLTMGQILCIPLAVVGLSMVVRSYRVTPRKLAAHKQSYQTHS